MPDSDWFDGYEYAGMPAWGPVTSPTDIVLIPSSYRMEPGAVSRLTAYSSNLAYLGKTAILSVTNPTVAGSPWYSAQMQPDAQFGVSAIFEVAGVAEGGSVFSVEVV